MQPKMQKQWKKMQKERKKKKKEKKKKKKWRSAQADPGRRHRSRAIDPGRPANPGRTATQVAVRLFLVFFFFFLL